MNKKLYYILNLTWGLPMTLIGSVVALFLIIVRKKRPQRHGGCLYFKVGKTNWGGLELGLIFLTDQLSTEHTKNHEFGHSIQNAVLGPLMPFVVCIPSAIRYWRYEYTYRHDRKKYYTLPKYDDAWFEGQATALGNKYIEKWRDESAY